MWVVGDIYEVALTRRCAVWRSSHFLIPLLGMNPRRIFDELRSTGHSDKRAAKWGFLGVCVRRSESSWKDFDHTPPLPPTSPLFVTVCHTLSHLVTKMFDLSTTTLTPPHFLCHSLLPSLSRTHRLLSLHSLRVTYLMETRIFPRIFPFKSHNFHTHPPSLRPVNNRSSVHTRSTHPQHFNTLANTYTSGSQHTWQHFNTSSRQQMWEQVWYWRNTSTHQRRGPTEHSEGNLTPEVEFASICDRLQVCHEVEKALTAHTTPPTPSAFVADKVFKAPVKSDR
jgi:hypothetical protein